MLEFYASELVNAGVQHFNDFHEIARTDKVYSSQEAEQFETSRDRALYLAITTIDAFSPHERVAQFRTLYDSVAVTEAQRNSGHMAALAGMDELIENDPGELEDAVQRVWASKRAVYLAAVTRNPAFPFEDQPEVQNPKL
jgi:hypothetical protein